MSDRSKPLRISHRQSEALALLALRFWRDATNVVPELCAVVRDDGLDGSETETPPLQVMKRRRRLF
jgi:hypothetical protein